MGIFRWGHKHVSPETLSEFLDGRLRSRARERLESAISGCADCRRELEQLRDISVMLRRLPVAAPRRSFVMAAPPVEIAQRRPISPFRLPQWTYAGAASMAALALAVLVSLDASGLVAPTIQNTVILKDEDIASISAESKAPIQERAIAADGAAGGLQLEIPPQQAVAESIQVEREAAVDAPAVAEMQAEAPAVAVMKAPVPPMAEMKAETSAEMSLETPMAPLQAAAEPAVESAQAEQVSKPITAESAPVQSERTSAAQPEAVEVLPLPTVVSEPAAPDSARTQGSPVADDEFAALMNPGTPLIWRLLEAALAVLFLALAAVFFLRRRASRRF